MLSQVTFQIIYVIETDSGYLNVEYGLYSPIHFVSKTKKSIYDRILTMIIQFK